MSIQDLVTDGVLIVAVLIAIAAGIVSFASPCVLPLVPGYLAYVGASAGSDSGTPVAQKRGRGRLVAGSLLFVTDFMKRHIRKVNVIGGSLLVLIGVLMATGLWAALMYRMQTLIDGYVTPV